MRKRENDVNKKGLTLPVFPICSLYPRDGRGFSASTVKTPSI